MFEILTSILRLVGPVSEILAPTMWASFAAYATWYFTRARHHAPLTRVDARLLWKIHKRNVKCKGRKWLEIRSKGKIVGFKCACGYEHVQNRPIVGTVPADEKRIESQTSPFDRLHTTYKST